MKRSDSRLNDQLRKVKIIPDYLAHPAGSALIDIGGTKVMCAVSFEPGVPPWMRAQGVPGGWGTCEYGLLPSSTHQRNQREASKGKQNGRTMEIQRLIGRSFRSVIDLIALGPNTIYIDCDVIDAHGGHPLCFDHGSIRRAPARIPQPDEQETDPDLSDARKRCSGQCRHEKRRMPAGPLLRGGFLRGCGYECRHDGIRQDR